MRKRTVKLWRLTEDGRKLSAGTIEAASRSSSKLKVPMCTSHRRQTRHCALPMRLSFPLLCSTSDRTVMWVLGSAAHFARMASRSCTTQDTTT